MGRYIPPDKLDNPQNYDKPRKRKKPTPVNTTNSTNAIRHQVVRFECPFAIWCTTCPEDRQIIGQGVRFNAEKRKVDAYYSTPVWSFRFKHTVCGGWIEVRTDPKNTEYVVVEGGRRRQDGSWGDGGGAWRDGEIEVGVNDGGNGRAKAGKISKKEDEGGAFGALEKKVVDKQQLLSQGRRLEQLEASSRRDWDDPYERSKLLRQSFRVERKLRKENEEKAQNLRDKFALGIDLVEENDEDAARAKLVSFGNMIEKDVNRGRLRVGRPLLDQPEYTYLIHGDGIKERLQNGDEHSDNNHGAQRSAKTRSNRPYSTTITKAISTSPPNSNENVKAKFHTAASTTSMNLKSATATKTQNASTMLARHLRGNTRVAVDPFLDNHGGISAEWKKAGRKDSGSAAGISLGQKGREDRISGGSNIQRTYGRHAERDNKKRSREGAQSKIEVESLLSAVGAAQGERKERETLRQPEPSAATTSVSAADVDGTRRETMKAKIKPLVEYDSDSTYFSCPLSSLVLLLRSSCSFLHEQSAFLDPNAVTPSVALVVFRISCFVLYVMFPIPFVVARFSPNITDRLVCKFSAWSDSFCLSLSPSILSVIQLRAPFATQTPQPAARWIARRFLVDLECSEY